MRKWPAWVAASRNSGCRRRVTRRRRISSCESFSSASSMALSPSVSGTPKGPAGVPPGFKTVRRTARKRCLGIWDGWHRFRAAPGVLRRRSGLLQAQNCFAARPAVLLAVRKAFSRTCRGLAGQNRLHGGPKPTPRTRGRGKPVTTEIRIPAAFRASSAPAARPGNKRKRLLPPASTRHAIRPAAEGGLG